MSKDTLPQDRRPEFLEANTCQHFLVGHCNLENDLDNAQRKIRELENKIIELEEKLSQYETTN